MILSLIIFLIGFTSGLPVEDTQLVGSSLHRVLAKPPADLKAAGDSSGYHDGGGDGDEGYHHTKSSKGDDGYKNYDTFHVKDGDSYGYEKHSAFGKADGDEDGGEYHESGSYNSDDGGEGTAQKPKVTSYHYESQSGTPKDYSNYNPETAGDDDEYEGSSLNEKIVPAESRRVHQDVEVTGPLRGPKFQSLADHSGQNPASKKTLKRLKKKTKNRDAQSASTEAEAEYDAYYDGEEEEGDSGEHEGGDYEGDYSSEGGDYYSEGEGSDY